MNIFLEYQQKIFKTLKKLEKKRLIQLPKNINFIVEIPPKNQNADLSCNVSMVLAKSNKNSPVKLAEFLRKHLLNDIKEFKSIEIAGPGFLNICFHIHLWKEYLSKVIMLDSKFGFNKIPKKKYNIEFVSANPTGPLHVGHCRGAILGDTLSNLLIFNGHKVIKEYYVNDHGGQIRNFVSSVHSRILEITAKTPFPYDKDLYPGEYIIDIAKKVIKNKSIKNFDNFESIYKKLSSESLKYSLQLIKKNLTSLGVIHDNFIYESDLINKKEVLKIVKNLKDKKYIYLGKLEAPKGEQDINWKKRELLLFKSTLFGDDSDRPLQKADGEWTYFAADMAYHSHKISRKFDILINILGADHAGYVKRITSATKAISNKFYGEGLEINPSNKEDILKLDYNIIVKLFEEKGLILFRNFNIKSNEIIKLTDLYTENYANDAQRRESRMNHKEIRNVDYGNAEMALHSEASFSPKFFVFNFICH